MYLAGRLNRGIVAFQSPGGFTVTLSVVLDLQSGVSGGVFHAAMHSVSLLSENACLKWKEKWIDLV